MKRYIFQSCTITNSSEIYFYIIFYFNKAFIFTNFSINTCKYQLLSLFLQFNFRYKCDKSSVLSKAEEMTKPDEQSIVLCHADNLPRSSTQDGIISFLQQAVCYNNYLMQNCAVIPFEIKPCHVREMFHLAAVTITKDGDNAINATAFGYLIIKHGDKSIQLDLYYYTNTTNVCTSTLLKHVVFSG